MRTSMSWGISLTTARRSGSPAMLCIEADDEPLVGRRYLSAESDSLDLATASRTTRRGDPAPASRPRLDLDLRWEEGWPCPLGVLVVRQPTVHGRAFRGSGESPGPPWCHAANRVSDEDLLTIVVPVRNEAASLERLCASVAAAEVPGMRKEIIVVDDGSVDGTAELLRATATRPGFMLFRHVASRGKGAAIRTALAHASGAIVLIQDADLEYDPRDYATLVEPIRSERARVCYGSRFLGSIEAMALANRVANRVLSRTATAIGPARITDEATCYKAFATDVLRALPLRCRGFEFCPEVTGLLQAVQEPIAEVPIRYRARTRSAGKKIRARDGFAAIVWLLWSRFGRRSDRQQARLRLGAGRAPARAPALVVGSLASGADP